MPEVKKILELLPSAKPEEKQLIEKAFHFAKTAHSEQFRKSGEPYFHHVFEVAKELANLGFDSATVAAGLLHDVLEDTKTKEEELVKLFGKEVTGLVKDVSRLGLLKYRGCERYVENMRRFFLAITKDYRVLVIKLVDRWHNVQTLNYLPMEKAKRIAIETIEIYARLANRLGMGRLKGELEDLAFPFAYPNEYKLTENLIKKKKFIDEKYLEKIKTAILKKIAKAGIKIIQASWRLKRKYSLYRKFLKKGNIEKIYDFVAIRLILPTVEDCYRALGVIHSHWQPVPHQIKDYIALPKPNGYRSLHTTIVIGDGGFVEVQLRTPQMHEEAEYGIAAHALYKEGIPAWQINLFQNRIFVFTPKGDVIDLPANATPIDFAYRIHSEIGNRTAGAKINGKLRPLEEKLKNGDLVEIITRKNARPSEKWLAFVKTSLAKKHIRNFKS